MTRSSSIALALAVGAAALGTSAPGCAPRPRMCSSTTECFAKASCVAGRCQPNRPNVRPAIDSARRVVVHPVDVAYVRRGGDAEPGVVPPLFKLGKSSAVLLLKFAVPLDASAKIVEAYVVLHRAGSVDDAPSPISLHATRIIEPWQGRSTSFARQPQLGRSRAPSTIVAPSGPALVRVDVRDLVRHWPAHDPRDQGVAVVAEDDTPTGTTFAFADLDADGHDPRPDVSPYLELYVR